MTTTPVHPHPPARHVPASRRPGRRRTAVLALVVVAAVVSVAVASHTLRAGPDDGGAAAAVGSPTSSPAAATGLDAELERRFEEARAAAAEEGVELWITSGWRSAAEQQLLVDQAVERYGSAEEAHRWVLPPEASEHVAGAAVDVGPTEGAYWLQRYGTRFGLCQTYANEVWHYEAAADPGGTCPPMHDDALHGWE